MRTLGHAPLTVRDLTPGQHAQLAREADDAILGRSLPAYWAYPVLALIFVFGLGYHHGHPHAAAAFLAAAFAVAAGRTAFHLGGAALRDRDPARWRVGFGIGVVAAVGAWTAFICYVLATDGVGRGWFFLLLCSTGISAGATNTLSPNLLLIRLHLMVGLPPIVVSCLLVPDPLRVPLAALIGFLLLFHLVEARRLHDDHWQILLGELSLRERQRANELLATAVENAAEAIAVVDTDGQVVHANSAFEAAGGPALLAALGPALHTAAVWRGDVRLGGDGGAARRFEATLSPVGATTTHRVLVARDVTERYRAEEERARMHDQLVLAERLASMGTLAAGIAHEINNPLAYVAGNLDHVAHELPRLRSDPPHGLLQELCEAIADAREGADRVRRIVCDLKTLSRFDGQRRPVDLVAVLDLAAKMAMNEIRPRARLVKDYRPVPPVEAEEGQLGQVFLGLLVNAAQAIDEGRPEENEIRLSTRDEDGAVVVEVHDTGAGVPPEIAGRIFEPFFTTKPVGVGTGLGLAICHGIVKSLGGEVTFASEVGRGSTFRVRLAAARGAVAAATPPPPAPRGYKATILVVDDEPQIASLVKRALAPGYEVVVETAARAALQRLRGGERYDALLCDLMMPDMTGMDLYAQLAPDLRERVIFLTGGAFTPRARSFLDSVTNLRIDKPFDRETLLRGVASVVGRTS